MEQISSGSYTPLKRAFFCEPVRGKTFAVDHCQNVSSVAVPLLSVVSAQLLVFILCLFS